jgi:hypothetical protein
VSKNEKFREAIGDIQRFVVGHEADLGQAFKAVGVVFDKAGELASAKRVDIREILTGDLVADRALLEAAGVQAELQGTGVTLESALDLAGALLKFGVVVAGFLA